MTIIITIIISAIILALAYLAFNIKIKESKKLTHNENLNKIVSKFPNNEEICKEILEMLNNENTKMVIENEKEAELSIGKRKNKKKKASFYIALTDTIYLSNIKDEYYRVQTIAHECIHSVQPKRLLYFNFIYSNVYLIYFVLSIILTITGVYKTKELQIIILTFMSFLYYMIRSYLETDAMTKAKYLAKDYMEKYTNENPICKKEDINKIVFEYEKINNLGIPLYNYILMIKCITKIIIYCLLSDWGRF